MLPEQSRAARGLLDWTQGKLAEEAGVSPGAIRKFENGATTPIRATITVIKSTLEAAGVEFLDPNGGGPGVRIRDWPPEESDG